MCSNCQNEEKTAQFQIFFFFFFQTLLFPLLIIEKSKANPGLWNTDNFSGDIFKITN